MYEIAVIGAGIVGTAACEKLSNRDVRVCLIDTNPDVANGTTKANSGIIHAGYDARPGTRMAELNVRGAALMHELCRRTNVPFQRCGSLVLSFSSEQDAVLQTLLDRGRRNGVADLQILTREQAVEMEPEISSKVSTALHAPSAGIVDPMALCVALAETAALNGADIILSTEVTRINWTGDHFVIVAGDREVRARWIVNAAGVHADLIHTMAGGSGFSIRPVRGEYYLLDKSKGSRVRHVIFQCPTAAGKGVLVAPTVHGNLIVGPSAEDAADPDNVATTRDGQDFVREMAQESVPGIDFRQSIRNFAGVRAYSDTGDFVIELSKQVPHFLNLAGICSPGLTSAPAIAEECLRLLQQAGLQLMPKANTIRRSARKRVRDMTDEECAEAVQRDSRNGHVVCRCETITEGEIIEALHRPPIPRTIDGLKKRLGTGMGRCQGSFCMPRILRILSEELHIEPHDILLGAEGSNILADGPEGGGDDAAE